MVVSKVQKGEKETTEERFYIASLPADARKMNAVARAHWGIENQVHWRLDVVFNEGKACIRNDNASENMDIVRKWALNICIRLKQSRISPLKASCARMLCLLSIF
jgi:predicted transposase YbfD/YdcC